MAAHVEDDAAARWPWHERVSTVHLSGTDPASMVAAMGLITSLPGRGQRARALPVVWDPEAGCLSPARSWLWRVELVPRWWLSVASDGAGGCVVTVRRPVARLALALSTIALVGLPVALIGRLASWPFVGLPWVRAGALLVLLVMLGTPSLDPVAPGWQEFRDAVKAAEG